MAQQNDQKNIYQRLRDVMLEVKGINKESKKVNNQYTFVSHDAVARALHDPLAKNGIMMVPTVTELRQEGNRTVAKIDVSFVNIDNPEDRISVTYWGYGIDNQDKGIGKAISYAVKYCLLKTFCLETGDDVEKDNIDYQENKQEYIERILEKCTQSQEALDYINKSTGGNLEKLELKRLVGIVNWLEDPNNKFFKQATNGEARVDENVRLHS